MKIKILGSGGAYGSPKILNKHGDIDINDKKNIRTRCSFMLFENDKKILVDCSPDIRYQTLKNDINDIIDIFITHDHADHIMGIWELVVVAMELKSEIKIWATNDVLLTIKSRFPYIFDAGFKDMKEGKITLNEIFLYKENIINSLEIIPLSFEHRNIKSTGFKYKNFVFTPDFHEITPETEKYLYDLDLWILENNNFIKKDNGHSDLETNLDRIKKYNPKKTIMTHLCEKIDYKKTSALLPNNVELAFDGMEFFL